MTSSDFFRAELADDSERSVVRRDFGDITPMVAVQGVATAQATGRRASRVQVYGVDERFWTFHGAPAAPGGGRARDVLLSPALARELGTDVGATMLLRVQRPSAIPIESLHGKRTTSARTLRLTVREVLRPAASGSSRCSHSRATCGPRSSRSHAFRRISPSATV